MSVPLSLPTELWVQIYSNLDVQSQIRLENTPLSGLIPPLERETVKKMITEYDFDPAWEKEENPERLQKITKYRGDLEELVRTSILCEKKIEFLGKRIEEIGQNLFELQISIISNRTSTLWGHIRTYVCKPETFLDSTVGKVLRSLKEVRESLDIEKKLESKITKKRELRAKLTADIEQTKTDKSTCSRNITKLKDIFDRDVLGKKNPIAIFGTFDDRLRLIFLNKFKIKKFDFKQFTIKDVYQIKYFKDIEKKLILKDPGCRAWEFVVLTAYKITDMITSVWETIHGKLNPRKTALLH